MQSFCIIIQFVQLVSVTKELCALRGAPRTEFDTSVDSFVQQVSQSDVCFIIGDWICKTS